jgi:hypothetical protein
VSPTTFDGKSLQLFGNASILLMSDDLKLLGEDGRTTDLAMRSTFGPAACGISSATLYAIPRPDGNSLVEATVSSGPSYSLSVDKTPRPLFLIGSQVYGLHETPFIEAGGGMDGCAKAPAGGAGINCVYHFLASTDALRAAQTFTVRDLGWKDFRKTGSIVFGPSFTALAVLGTKPSGVTAVCPSETSVTPPKCSPPPLYSLTGFQFHEINDPLRWNCRRAGCLELYQGLDRFHLTTTNFRIQSKTAAVLQLSGPAAAIAYDYKSLRIIWHASDEESVEWDLSIPQETRTPITASSILNVGDSTQIVFSGVDIPGTPTPAPVLVFDGTVVNSTTYKYEAAKKTLTVAITTIMTSKPGHKEMTLSYYASAIPGQQAKLVQLQLPFEVTKR